MVTQALVLRRGNEGLYIKLKLLHPECGWGFARTVRLNYSASTTPRVTSFLLIGAKSLASRVLMLNGKESG